MHAIEHTYVSLLADVARLTGFSEIRGSYEGLQWCLIEAPKLEKLILDAIETGVKPDLDQFPAWLRRLAGRSVEDPLMLRCLRQLLLFCYKAYVQHDEYTTEQALQKFANTNSEVRQTANDFSSRSPACFDWARKHCQSVLYRFQARDIVPSHGPGSVFESEKTRWSNWYTTIEAVYPYSDYMCLYFNRDHLAELGDCQFRDEIVAKLIAVPKDSRGPRLICVHPAESIWIQQGVRCELERIISSRRPQFGLWPRGRVRFEDQSVNQQIALKSSKSRYYATLDLAEASDRLADVLVQALFGAKYKYFGCCRAQKYVVGTPGKYQGLRDDIHSYAPMGNATTFPVQSLVFWALCCSSLRRLGLHQPGAAFVFGDDIIVPSTAAEFVIDDLEACGLRVNRRKSFWRGGFRESCGVDAFNGIDVTPVRWKCDTNAEHLSGLQSLSDIAMRLRIAGYEEAASAAYLILRRRLYGDFGRQLFLTNNRNHGGIAEYVARGSQVWGECFWHKASHQFATQVWRPQALRIKRQSSHWNEILESLSALQRTSHSSIPVRDVSRRLRLVRGWIPVEP